MSLRAKNWNYRIVVTGYTWSRAFHSCVYVMNKVHIQYSNYIYIKSPLPIFDDLTENYLGWSCYNIVLQDHFFFPNKTVFDIFSLSNFYDN